MKYVIRYGDPALYEMTGDPTTQEDFDWRMKNEATKSAKAHYDLWKALTSKPFDESLVTVKEVKEYGKLPRTT